MVKVQQTMSLVLQHTLLMQQQRQQQQQQQHQSVSTTPVGPISDDKHQDKDKEKDKGSDKEKDKGSDKEKDKGYDHALALTARWHYIPSSRPRSITYIHPLPTLRQPFTNPPQPSTNFANSLLISPHSLSGATS